MSEFAYKEIQVKKMHLIYTAPRYHTNQYFIVKGLLELGHTVAFLVLTQGQSENHSSLSPTILGYSPVYDLFLRLAGKCLRKNFTKIPPGGGSRTGGVPPVIKFWREMRRKRPTTVIIRDPLTSYGQLSILVSKILRAKIILYVQDPKHKRLHWRQKIVCNLFTWILDADWITPVLGPVNKLKPFHNRVYYVPAVTQPQTSPKNKKWFLNNKINILAIGKFQTRKNHLLFLDAIFKLSRYYSIHATIIGECSTSDHKKEYQKAVIFSKKKGLKKKVSFVVNIPFIKVQEYYRKSDLFVIPSRNEPLSISPLEAMSHSLPVICSDSNGFQYNIQHKKNGRVFKTDDVGDLVKCIERTLKNRQKLITMGEHSYKLATSEHTVKRYIDTIATICKIN